MPLLSYPLSIMAWVNDGTEGTRANTVSKVVLSWHCPAVKTIAMPVRSSRQPGRDFGGEAAPRAAQSLGGVPAVFFNAPAAC